MILTKNLKIKISYNNIDHYKNFFDDLKIGKVIEISPNQLSNKSHKLILIKCDICGLEKELEYRYYIKNINNCGYFTCVKCKYEKSKKTNLKKHGIENYNNIEKIRNTNLEKYGVENTFQNENIKNKIKKTNLEKYNTKFSSQVKEFKEKSVKTKLERYGYTHHLKNKNILQKQHDTNIKKYGVEYISQNKEIMNDIIRKSKITRKKTFLKKYEKLDIKELDYENKTFKMKCDCGKDHYFEIQFGLFHNRKYLKNSLCTICNPINSTDSDQENKLLEFIENNYKKEIVKNDRKIINQEIDIYLPDLKLAFEFNGLYWHSELFKENNYHLVKTELIEKQGIKLIHIYEDHWLFKRNIVESRILNLLNKSEKIMARKCTIVEINDDKLIKKFLEQNHLQGFVGSKIKIGLFYKDELISLMTFGSYRKAMGQKINTNSYEMLRFCNKLNTNVIGGASRLFKYFINNYKPKEVISYADRSWSQGELYKKLGFQFSHKTQPNYYYFLNKKRLHRFNFRKDKLIKDGADPNKTEHEIMLEKEIYRIYDSGNLKFIWTS